MRASGLVRVVETRGIEPLTPALQRRGITRDYMDCAGHHAIGGVAVGPAGHSTRKFGAIAGAIGDRRTISSLQVAAAASGSATCDRSDCASPLRQRLIIGSCSRCRLTRQSVFKAQISLSCDSPCTVHPMIALMVFRHHAARRRGCRPSGPLVRPASTVTLWRDRPPMPHSW